jgi:CheY-like chemotaxis protein
MARSSQEARFRAESVMSDRRFCMCCGEEVPTVLVQRAGRPELNCIFCGFTIEILAPGQEAAQADAGQPAAAAQAAAAAPSEPPPAVPCIIAVDDADTHRSLLQGLLERSRLADEIVALHSGAEMVSTVARRFAEGQPVSLVILDVEMPAMDGFTAARFLRSLEAKMRRPPCPVIFFTARKADDNLRRQMAALRPAWYCAKGVDAGRESFERRATCLIGHVTALLAAPAP